MYRDSRRVLQDFRLTATLNMAWADPRLQSLLPADSDTIFSIRGADIDRIWLPDLYFPLLKAGEIHEITSTNRAVRVSKHLGVLYSIRLTLTQSCNMMLSNYPFDSRWCHTFISTFFYHDDELKLRWMYSQLVDTGSSIRLNLPQFGPPTVRATDFTLQESYPLQEDIQFNFSTTVLSFSICLDRMVDYLILTELSTSFILSFLSWLNYWLDPDKAPARVSLGITTVLAAITQANSTMKRGPQLSYTTALDIWLTANVNVTIIGLAEYGLVHGLILRAKKLEERLKGLTENQKRLASKPEQEESRTSFVLFREGCTAPKECNTDEGQPSISPSIGQLRQSAKRYRKWANRIDCTMRVAVPLFLVVFTAMFFVTYTVLWNEDECAQ